MKRDYEEEKKYRESMQSSNHVYFLIKYLQGLLMCLLFYDSPSVWEGGGGCPTMI